MSDNKNIYQRIRDVIAEGEGYIKRGSAGQGTGVLYDEAIAVLTPLLTKHGIVFSVEKTGESRSRKNAKDNYIYECDFNVHYINIDEPSDRFTTLVEAHAMDSGDKAPGKAITYAAKISLLKVFQIETGLNDESRGEVKERTKTVSKDQIDELSKYCIYDDGNGSPQWSEVGTKLMKAYNIQSITDLLASNYEQALERCKRFAGKPNENNQ